MSDKPRSRLRHLVKHGVEFGGNLLAVEFLPDNAEFYHSKAWKSMTALCKLKANGLDLYELVINNNIVKGTLSHHIDELEEDRSKALDINNLIWISDKTHSYIHSEYNKNLESKNKMKEVLFNIIKNYYK